MRQFRNLGLPLLVAAVLAACGGGTGDEPGSVATSGAPTTKGSFTAVVSFGDSLSDVGSYAPVTSLAGDGSAPYMGGRFTTNSSTATVWVENIAASLGITMTAAEVGYAGSSVQCPAAYVASALAGTCTAYGQGGSRVTDANGIGHSGGALTVPVVTQIANHLSRFGSFKASDLILVWAGHNDAFTQLNTFVATAQQVQAQLAAGTLTADQANLALYEAQLTAHAAMKLAAQELAGYVRNQIVAKGGKYVAVMTLVDIGDTPMGQALPASVREQLTDLSRIFNLWLRDGLANQAVQIVDAYALNKTMFSNPSQYGFTNVTATACDATKISAITGGQVTSGSSLFCNATSGVPYNGLTDGADVDTWLFADSVHPTTGGHKVLAEQVLVQLKAYGWL